MERVLWRLNLKADGNVIVVLKDGTSPPLGCRAPAQEGFVAGGFHMEFAIQAAAVHSQYVVLAHDDGGVDQNKESLSFNRVYTGLDIVSEVAHRAETGLKGLCKQYTDLLIAAADAGDGDSGEGTPPLVDARHVAGFILNGETEFPVACVDARRSDTGAAAAHLRRTLAARAVSAHAADLNVQAEGTGSSAKGGSLLKDEVLRRCRVSKSTVTTSVDNDLVAKGVTVEEALVTTQAVGKDEELVKGVAHAFCLDLGAGNEKCRGEHLFNAQLELTKAPLVAVIHPLSAAAVVNDYHGFAEHPNAGLKYQPHRDMYAVVASRSIKEGEQIVIDYGDGYSWPESLLLRKSKEGTTTKL